MNFQILAEDFDPDTVNWNMKRDEVGRFVAGTAPSLFDDLIALYKALQPSGENVFFTAETNDVDDLLNNLIDGRGILPIPSDLSVFKVRPEEEESIFFGKVAWVGGICHTDCMQLRAPAHYTILGLVLLVAGMGAGLGYGLSRTHTNPGMARAHPQENGNAFFDLDDPILHLTSQFVPVPFSTKIRAYGGPNSREDRGIDGILTATAVSHNLPPPVKPATLPP